MLSVTTAGICRRPSEASPPDSTAVSSGGKHAFRDDYGLRLGIAYDPEVVLYHYHWRDAQERTARYGDYACGRGEYYGTHLRHGDFIILMQAARDVLRRPVRSLRGLILRDRERTENGRVSTLNLLPGGIAGLRRKSFPASWPSSVRDAPPHPD